MYMNPSFVFHFIKLSAPRKLQNFISLINQTGASALFDLEDACLIPFSNLKTSLQKIKTRNRLLLIFLNNPGLFLNKFIGIRINPVNSEDFLRDIDMLVKLSKTIYWSYIFIPKIESPGEIKICLDTLNSNHIQFGEIIPIIESQAGYNNLNLIFHNKPSPQLNKVAFGHCDYNLSLKQWPFRHQNSFFFWNKVRNIIATLEDAGFHYVNTPFLELDNDKFFGRMLSTVNSLCKLEFGQVTLTLKQTELCSQPKIYKKIDFKKLKDNNFKSVIDKINFTNRLMTLYEQNKKRNKSFAITKEDKILISPQEYIAAINYLRGNIE